jgi:Protein of unknown function DUF115
MLNASDIVPDSDLKVLNGVELKGGVNVSDDIILKNIESAIRRQVPQIRTQPPNRDRVVLVGGGPSLNYTEQELVQLIQEGAKLVTVNGAYHWCLERNLFPKTQIVMDARASNSRFVEPEVPNCNYVLASQCAPETWDKVINRSSVWIFHAVGDSEGEAAKLLDKFYMGQWFGVGGGTTVVSRAISLLRMTGYMRFDLFGVDCCFLDKNHHAYPQPENVNDQAFPFVVYPEGHSELARTFMCAPWHAKQFEDFLQLIKINGQHFMLNVHGDGLLAYTLEMNANIVVESELTTTT